MYACVTDALWNQIMIVDLTVWMCRVCATVARAKLPQARPVGGNRRPSIMELKERQSREIVGWWWVGWDSVNVEADRWIQTFILKADTFHTAFSRDKLERQIFNANAKFESFMSESLLRSFVLSDICQYQNWSSFIITFLCCIWWNEWCFVISN